MHDIAAVPVHATADRSGDMVRVVLTVDLPDGVHIEPHEPADPFLIPTVVTVDGLDALSVRYPEPVEKDLGWHGAVLTVLEGRLVFVVTGVLSTSAPGTVTGSLRYQRCIGGACLPPTTTAWSVNVPAPIAAVTRLRD